MATLPPIKRFIQDDFASISTIAAFAGKLFYPLNLFLNATYSAFANGITLNANTIGKVVSLTNVKSNSSGIATTSVNWPFPQSAPVGVVVMNASQSSTPVTLPQVSWSYSAGVVNITLQFTTISSGAVVAAATGTYSVTFWVSGG